MRIAGLQKVSFVDYPGKLATVFFTPGCNWNCFYCHNKHLIAPNRGAIAMTDREALTWLDSRRRKLVEAVVISGGEPTLQRGLPDFLRQLRQRGYVLKLDTNGSRPHVLRALLDEGLLDFVAMDLKAPPHRYEEVCETQIAIPALDESIQLLLLGRVEHEFRTTVAPQLSEDDVVLMAHWIRGAQRYVLQQFRRPEEQGVYDLRNAAPPHPKDFARRIAPRLAGLVKEVAARGFEAVEADVQTSI